MKKTHKPTTGIHSDHKNSRTTHKCEPENSFFKGPSRQAKCDLLIAESLENTGTDQASIKIR